MAMLLDHDYDGFWVALAAGGYLVGATVGYFLAVDFATGVIRRRATEAGEAVSAAPAASATRRAPWRSALTRPLHLPPIRAVDIGGRNRFNPLALATRLWQEARRHPFAAAVFLAIVLAPGLTGGGLRAYRAFPLYAGVYALAVPLLLLVTLLQAASCFSHERERQRLELLLATGQRGRDLVRGTYLALLAAVYPYLLGLGLVVILGALISAPNAYFPSRVSAWAIVWLVLYLNFLLVLGMRISLRSRTNLRAVGWLFLAVGALAFVPFALAGVLEMVRPYEMAWRISLFVTGTDTYANPWYEADTWPDLVRGLNCLSPLSLLTLGIEVASWRELWDKHPVAITLNVALYVAATALLYLRMATRFDRIVGRQPGG